MLFLSGPTAMAQSRPYPECTAEPTESDIAGAKGAFQAGQASFNEGDYKRAITYWEDSYRRDCTAHDMLLNLARAYELDRDNQQAVEALRTFLARKPETPKRDEIERRIAFLSQQETASAPPPVAQAETKPQEKPAPAEPPPAEAAPKPPPEPKNRWIGPVVVGGVGLAATVSGVVLHSVGSSDEQAAEDACPTRQECEKSVEEQGNSGIFKQKLGVGLIIGGGVAMAGGVAWYLLTGPDASAATPADGPQATRTNPPKSRWLVLPEAGQGYAGLTAVGSF
jgi:hypothetical protein